MRGWKSGRFYPSYTSIHLFLIPSPRIIAGERRCPVDCFQFSNHCTQIVSSFEFFFSSFFSPSLLENKLLLSHGFEFFGFWNDVNCSLIHREFWSRVGLTDCFVRWIDEVVSSKSNEGRWRGRSKGEKNLRARKCNPLPLCPDLTRTFN